MINNLNINGSIGYTYLQDSKNKILILADMHSTLPYCNNGVFVSDWINNKNKSKILLEEVPRTDTILKELWPTSIHTQKLKELYLNSKIIDGVDIRPFLISFSWELLEDPNIEVRRRKEMESSSLYDYFKFISLFFNLKHEYIMKNLNKIYTKDFLQSSLLGKHFIRIKNETKKFIQDNDLLFNKPVYILMRTNQNILNTVNDIISNIMEWYTIAKIFQGNLSGYNNFIIHAGLAHTSNINLILQKEYNYNINNFDGIINLKDGDNYTNGCLKLPSYIDDQFGGGFGII